MMHLWVGMWRFGKRASNFKYEPYSAKAQCRPITESTLRSSTITANRCPPFENVLL